MSDSRSKNGLWRKQLGLTHVEVLIAAIIISAAMVPAMDALHVGMLGTQIYQSSSAEHYSSMGKMEELLAEQYNILLTAAAIAGNETTISSYSDDPATPSRRLVFLSLYDANDADGDSNVFTVPDPNLDGDNNPFTGYQGPIWLRVEVEGSSTSFESLAAL